MMIHPRPPQPKAAQQTSHTVLWIALSTLAAALSIWAVFSQAQEISAGDLLASVGRMRPGWLLAAIACMLGFIAAEACAIRRSCALLDVHCPVRKSLTYSTADI